ncbi:MAG: hypothetical protein JWL72_4271 [Ilumatobacteraceae bacterium]|nr:hypothetical protein [Ilumatobacteraceae bacterium]MCU1390933.1 hypothetical protein [Ilumatobacteraceae bacterium]
MAFKLRAITDTHGIGDETKRRYVYVDKSTGKTMTLLAPLYPTDDVDGLLNREPTRQHTMKGGALRIVTTWSHG